VRRLREEIPVPQVTNLVEDVGFVMPFVCTPEELMGETHD
jgi:hypothetical protein